MESLEAVVNRVTLRTHAAAAVEKDGDYSDVEAVDVARRVLSGEVPLEHLDDLLVSMAHLAAELQRAVGEGHMLEDAGVVGNGAAYGRKAIFVGLAQTLLLGRWLPPAEEEIRESIERIALGEGDVAEGRQPTPLEASADTPAFESFAETLRRNVAGEYRPPHGGRPEAQS